MAGSFLNSDEITQDHEKCTIILPANVDTIIVPGEGGGAHVKILTGMLVLFFGFEIWPNPIFRGGKFYSYFSGFRKISAIFLGLTNFQLFFGVFQFLYHTLEPLNEEHT